MFGIAQVLDSILPAREKITIFHIVDIFYCCAKCWLILDDNAVICMLQEYEEPEPIVIICKSKEKSRQARCR